VGNFVLGIKAWCAGRLTQVTDNSVVRVTTPNPAPALDLYHKMFTTKIKGGNLLFRKAAAKNLHYPHACWPRSGPHAPQIWIIVQICVTVHEVPGFAAVLVVARPVTGRALHTGSARALAVPSTADISHLRCTVQCKKAGMVGGGGWSHRCCWARQAGTYLHSWAWGRSSVCVCDRGYAHHVLGILFTLAMSSPVSTCLLRVLAEPRVYYWLWCGVVV
jgi:hypothetical protein